MRARRLVVQSTYGVGETKERLSFAWRCIISLVLKPQIADTEEHERIVRGEQGIVGENVGEGLWSGAVAGCVGGRSFKGAGNAAVGCVRETRVRQGATCRAVCR